MMTIDQFCLAFNKCTSHGWLSWREALLLACAADSTMGAMVEVGSYQGRSAMLLSAMRTTQGGRRRLHCIDTWDDAFHTELKGDEIFRRFWDHVSPLYRPHWLSYLVIHRRRVEDMTAESIDDDVGFVYLDGDHTHQGTLAQCKFALSLGPSVIAVHDVSNSEGGRVVKDAALSVLGDWTERADTLAVWVRK